MSAPRDRRTQLTLFDRPSSWGSSDSDSPLSASGQSPSCYTLSPTCTSAISQGTIPLALAADSPLDSENSTASSLSKLAWQPLQVPIKDKGNNREESSRGNMLHKSSPPPPMPEWPMGIPKNVERQMVPQQRVTIEVSGESRKSEYPEVDQVSSPEDVEPLPSHAYIPEHARQEHRHRQSEIALAIGSPSQQEYRYQQPEQMLHSEHDTTLTSPAYPAAVEDYYAPTPHPGNEPNITVINNNVTVTHQHHAPASVLVPAPAPAPVQAPAPPAPRVQSPPPTGEWRPPAVNHHHSVPTPPVQLAPRSNDLSNIHPAHRRSISVSSSTQLIPSHQRTRSFSGKAPTLFKLNPGGEKFPAPPGTDTRESFSFAKATLRGGAASDDESDDDNHYDYTGAGKQWRIQITTPLSICLLFFCGLISATLHHIFYTQLHRTAPTSDHQEWYTRAGIAIALFTTSVWAACVAICYRQRVWTALMQRCVKVNGIDALWGLLSDPSQFLVKEAWRKSKLAMFVGAICWLLPLTTVFVPGALIILPHEFETQQTCLVSSFDPPDAAAQNLNIPQGELDRLAENKTVKDISLIVERPDVTRLSAFSKRMGAIASFSGSISDISLPEGCGLNCSYTISFTAPGYKCETKTQDEARERGPWGKLGFEQLFRTGKDVNETFFYSSLADNQTSSQSEDGKSIGQTDEERLGMGSFWVAYRYLPQEVTDESPEFLKDPAKAPKDKFVDEIFRCTDYVVEYNNVRFDYISGRMAVTLPTTEEEGMRYIAPVNYASRFRGETDPAVLNRVVHDFTSSILLGNLVIRKTPVRNSTIDEDPDKDGFVADIFRTSQLEGTFLMDETRTFGESFTKSSTGVRERFRMPSANLREGVESLHRNVTLSFLSEPRLSRTFWSPTTCTTRSNGLIYEYKPLGLLITYGSACFLVLVGMTIGFFSLKVNGFCTDFSFSRILCTTRGNPTLDEVFRGDCCLGNVDEKQGREEIRFGEVLVKNFGVKSKGTIRRDRHAGMKLGLGTLNEERESDLERGEGEGPAKRMGHASFGLLGEVVGLRRDKGYA